MNKLKKKSRTLAYAEAEGPIYHEKPDAISAQSARNLNQVAIRRPTGLSGHAAHLAEEATHALATFYAKSLEEQASQAWITRALKAEAMLIAREKEYTLLSKQHSERQAILERLVHILLAIVTALIFIVVYQASLYHRNESKRSRWSSPAHFTIPILSPFTSVIEHETSVVSSKTIAVFLCVAGCVVYLAFRYWISRR